MLPECQHVYPDGHRCGRIPRRGQPHCPTHSRPQLLATVPIPVPAAASAPDPSPANDPAFRRQMQEWADQCARMPFPELLRALTRILCTIEVYLVTQHDSHTRAIVARAAIAIGSLIERIAVLPPESVPSPLPTPLAGRLGGKFSNLMIQSLLNLPE